MVHGFSSLKEPLFVLLNCTQGGEDAGVFPIYLIIPTAYFFLTSRSFRSGSGWPSTVASTDSHSIVSSLILVIRDRLPVDLPSAVTPDTSASYPFSVEVHKAWAKLPSWLNVHERNCSPFGS